MKKIVVVFMLSLIWMLSACGKKENVEEKRIEPFPVSEELFLYERTEEDNDVLYDDSSNDSKCF